MNDHPLRPLFQPASVAVVGASERTGSLGKIVWDSLRAGGFAGTLHAVNPKYASLGGHPCKAGFSDLPRDIDLAVICVPAARVPQVMKDAGKHGVRTAVVLSAGFGETGAAGKALETELVDIARRHGMRLLGPNCVGLQRSDCGLNASFAATPAKQGDVALLSQSGAICTALVDAAWQENFGFSSVISLGAGADLDFGEVLDFLANDPATRSILLYVEGIRHARSFMSSLRQAARVKPVLVLKAGRHAAGARAALSHTGALVGDDGVFTAALARCGAVRVDAYEQLFNAARALALHQRMNGERIAIVTNGGGPGVLTADAAMDNGLVIAELTAATRKQLGKALPDHAATANPVDVIGDADSARFEAALRAVLDDANVDGVVTLHCPTRVEPAAAIAAAIAPLCKSAAKPVLTVWLGNRSMSGIAPVLEASGVPAFESPTAAAAALGALVSHRRNQRQLMHAPAPLAMDRSADFDAARAVFASVLAQGRTLLTEVESKTVLAACGIEVPRTLTARSAEDAVKCADSLGYPVVLKVLSPQVAHKSDVDGVRLDVRSADGVRVQFAEIREALSARMPAAVFSGVAVQPMVKRRHARELLIGVAKDKAFGPVITCGSGGVAVELMRDFAVGLPPLNADLAQDLVEQTRVGRLLRAYRDVPAVKLDAVLETLLRISDMTCQLPQLAELDLNPVLANEDGALVLDARMVIDPAQPSRPDSRYSHLAIHPYPQEWTSSFKAGNGKDVTIRPIRPEDAALETRFIDGLSAASRYSRFLSSMREADAATVARFTQVDYDREMAFVAVAEADTGTDPAQQFVGVGRYVTESDRSSCEFAVVVADAWQGRGLGCHLVERLITHASARGIERMWGVVMASNQRMAALMRHMGFDASPESGEPGLIHFERRLAGGETT
jgi:acetyltransferase